MYIDVNTKLLKDIHNLNLTYLLLLKKMATEDTDLCIARLGIAEDLFHEIISCSLQQMIAISQTNQLIVRPRFESPSQIRIITEDSRVSDIKNLHSSILLVSSINHQGSLC